MKTKPVALAIAPLAALVIVLATVYPQSKNPPKSAVTARTLESDTTRQVASTSNSAADVVAPSARGSNSAALLIAPAKFSAPFSVQGTMATGDAATAVAMLADEQGMALGNFRIGEQLPGGSVLSAIGTQSISVELEGRQYDVQMVLDRSAKNSSAATSSQGRGKSSTASVAAFGAWDGDLGNAPAADMAVKEVDPQRRSRSGPLLSYEERAALEDAALAY